MDKPLLPKRHRVDGLEFMESRAGSEAPGRSPKRAQALGESLDPDKLERLGRYEVHLDRKLDRTLSTLIRLQELRRTKPPAAVQA